MKNWKIKIWAFALCGCAVAACSDMNDLHDPYLKGGETIYLAKLDSISLHPGKERMMVEYWNTDPKAVKCIVKWDLGESVQKVDITMTEGETPNTFYIDDLKETTISFDFAVYTADEQYCSLVSNATTTIYGEKYRTTLMNANIKSHKYAADTQELSFEWSSNYENVVAYLIKYTDINNHEQTVREGVKEDRKVTLPDFPEGGSLEYATVYLPVEGALDEFATDYSVYSTAGR